MNYICMLHAALYCLLLKPCMGDTQERRQIRCDVVVDALGSFSPISAQARKGRKPDSVVLLVGTCAQGLPPTASADLLWSFTPINRSGPCDFRSYTILARTLPKLWNHSHVLWCPVTPVMKCPLACSCLHSSAPGMVWQILNMYA